MVNDPTMPPTVDSEPITRSEFRSSMTDIDRRFDVSQIEFRSAMTDIDRLFDVSQTEFRSAMTDVNRRFDASQNEFRLAMTDIDRRFSEMNILIDQRSEEAKRHMGVLHEDMLHKFDLMFECLNPLRDRVGRHETRLTSVETDIDIIKTHLRSHR
jgi:hypothetical protein